MSSIIISGTIWSAVQRFGSLGISFISNVILARLLCPEDFGVMGMIMVFVSIADVIVDGGMGNALIQKRNLTESDLKTVFTTNLFFSTFLFLVFFGSANYIESLTAINHLAIFLKIESVQIICKALYVVPFSLMMKEMKFEALAQINITASIISVLLSVILAWNGCGIWSLIAKNLSLDIVLMATYFFACKYLPRLGFNKKSFSDLFGFGFFIMLSNLLETGYTNCISFLIGKNYSVKELGYYNQAYTLQQTPTYSISGVLNQVLFPYFSKMQDEDQLLKNRLQSTIRVVTFVVFPLLIFLIFYAEQIITIVYSDKWLPCIPYFQILCISGLVNAMIHVNRSLLKSKGLTKLVFSVQILSAIIGISLLIFGLRYNMIIAVFTVAAASIINYLITSYCVGRIIGYSLINQVKDYLFTLVFSLVAIIITKVIFNGCYLNVFLSVILEGVVFLVGYFTLHVLFKTSSICEVSLILKLLKNK